MTQDIEVAPLHVRNMTAFLASTQYRVIPKDTLLFDFVFFLHPVRAAPRRERPAPRPAPERPLRNRAPVLPREGHFHNPSLPTGPAA
jgi:hypothetical protein